MGEAERGESAPRLRISFWCSNGHETQPSFASDAQVPDTWDCPRCGFPAGQDRDNPARTRRAPSPTRRTLAYVRERRSDADSKRSSPRRSPNSGAGSDETPPARVP
ncbi:RNA polymerase-binding protein RbpA [Streptomyces glaucescens]